MSKSLESNPHLQVKAVNLLNVSINVMSLGEVLDYIEEIIKANTRLKIGVVNVAKIVNMQKDRSLERDVKGSDIVLADGAGVVWAARVMGLPLHERVAGIDLMYGLFERGCRVYCLGASEDISQKVEQRLVAEFPQVTLVGRRNGYFSEAEEGLIVEKINQAKPEVLFVAISSPMKERFMARWGDQLEVPVIHGVGGSFDVFAGKVKRAPKSWQQYGMEWLYRLLQEPRRMWKRYLVTNSLFFCMVCSQFFRKKYQGITKRTAE